MLLPQGPQNYSQSCSDTRLLTSRYTALAIASKYNQSEVIDALLRAKADVTRGGAPIVHAASQRILLRLLEEKAGVNATALRGRTKLIRVAEDPDAHPEGRIHWFELLISHKASVNAARKDGTSALMVLSQRPHPFQRQAAEILLSTKQVHINARDLLGNTALTIACQQSNLEMARLLVQHDADVNVQNASGYSPLMWAASHGDTQSLKVLLNSKSIVHANANNENLHGKTVFSYAVEHENLDMVRCMLAAKIAPGRPQDLILLAAQRGNARILRLLGDVCTHVNPDLRSDSHGLNAMAYACWHLDVGMVRYLVEHFLCSVNAKDTNGNTPLHNALRVVGENVSVHALRSQTARKSTSFNRMYRVVKYLVDEGTDPRIENKQGKNPDRAAKTKGGSRCQPSQTVMGFIHRTRLSRQRMDITAALDRDLAVTFMLHPQISVAMKID